MGDSSPEELDVPTTSRARRFVLEFDNREGNRDLDKKIGYCLPRVVRELTTLMHSRPKKENGAMPLYLEIRTKVHLPLGDICFKEKVPQEDNTVKEIVRCVRELKQEGDLDQCLQAQHDHFLSQIKRMVCLPDEVRTGLILLFRHDRLEPSVHRSLNTHLTRIGLRGKPWFCVNHLPNDENTFAHDLAWNLYNTVEELSMLEQTGANMIPEHRRIELTPSETSFKAKNPVDHLFKAIRSTSGVGAYIAMKMAKQYGSIAAFTAALNEKGLSMMNEFDGKALNTKAGLGPTRMKAILVNFGIAEDEDSTSSTAPKKRKRAPSTTAPGSRKRKQPTKKTVKEEEEDEDEGQKADTRMEDEYENDEDGTQVPFHMQQRN